MAETKIDIMVRPLSSDHSKDNSIMQKTVPLIDNVEPLSDVINEPNSEPNSEPSSEPNSEPNSEPSSEPNSELDVNVIEKSADEMGMDALKVKVAKILCIENNKHWYITDVDGSLVMIHYSDEADMKKYGVLRGVVVDVNREIIVADSYGYTPSAKAESLIPDTDGNVVLEDSDGLVHSFKAETAVIRHGLEGVMIRVFRWNGKTYYAAHRKLDTSRSKWGDSPYFFDLYKAAGGPMNLFPSTVSFSPFVYFFLIEHPKLLHVTKNMVEGPILYNLCYRTPWTMDPQDCPFRYRLNNLAPALYPGQTVEQWGKDKREDVGYIHPVPAVPPNMVYKVPSIEEERATGIKHIVRLPSLTVEQTNTLLRYGYLNYKNLDDTKIDPRLRTGEFAVLYKQDGTLLRIESPAYSWRASLTNDVPKRKYRFYQLADRAKIRPSQGRKGSADYKRWIDDLKYFRSIFPPMAVHNVEDVRKILNQGQLYLWNPPDFNDKDLRLNDIDTFPKRLYNIWACFLIASPYNRQLEILDLYAHYFDNRKQFVDWLQSNKEIIMEQKAEDVEKHFMAFSEALKDVTGRAINSRSFRGSIMSFLSKGQNATVYRLYREMERQIRWKENPKEELISPGSLIEKEAAEVSAEVSSKMTSESTSEPNKVVPTTVVPTTVVPASVVPTSVV